MRESIRTQGLLHSVQQILSHGVITMLAVAIAFSLPQAAQYILYEWWPLVEKDANLLLATEIGLASVLVLLFNFAKIVWGNRQTVAMAKLTALAYARNERHDWLSRRRERALVKRLSAARDAHILTLTGHDTFVDERSPLRAALKTAYEIRVMLVNPVGKGLRRRIDSLPPEITLLSFHKEIEASIAYLAELRKSGKKVTLKFYEHEPFWKVVVFGDHVWVQHCHTGYEVKHQPEYIFALQHRNPREGLYVPFYMHFLDQWSQPCHPEYDFATNELVYRDETGNECRRAALGVPINGNGVAADLPGPAAEKSVLALGAMPAGAGSRMPD
ncbi:MAG: hypothetical protein EPO19_00115 [Betaproteobacteria bacterium]|nr:MAG: hypothetical protein EPO19_00115 [Betaproteobacteria bacterium]